MEPYLKSVLDEFSNARETFIRTLTNRFNTYGYQKITTPVFENYHLYTSVQGTIPLDEMVKVISPDGKVLVLRPDVTIPITQLASLQHHEQTTEARYAYILDVFRNSFHSNDGYVKTQAGVEFLGSARPEADFEVISLAINGLLDLEFTSFKIEIGHAGVMKEMLKILSLSNEQEDQFKQYITSKNFTSLEEFLFQLDIDPSVKQSLLTLPLLYGRPDDVLEKALSLSLTTQMTRELERLQEVYELLTLYGFGDYVVIDLGLINNMGYYSDIIFQGYIENIGKPILLGGRYDYLAEQFANPVPAIGFAYDVDALLASNPNSPISPQQIYIQYDQNKAPEALRLTKRLRDLNYTTILSNTVKLDSNCYSISINNTESSISYRGFKRAFTNVDELQNLLQTMKEEVPCNP
ncbi:ATP phosphoribosyltransferase regulatory subunit [Ornithinibacillus californiensis]|uniref:ATP phosphoribosyltransferase regulatory subunit n=1 Tax=Ornithinibacillus californiensis TaxID=161536 RepID=UPI00064DA1FB|nr:ATP phosphoribosyltransferase regulatory subunit [Ornithinibacillus californiensis]